MKTPGPLASLMLGLLLPVAALSIEPHRDGQQAFIARAVFVEGRLWLLTDAGELSSITEGSDKRVEETALAEPVHDICIHQHTLFAVTCQRDGCTKGSLRTRDHDKWSIDATLPLRDERVLALMCDSPGMSLLTTRRLIDFDHADHRDVRLSEPLDAKPVAAVHDSPSGVFIGFNAGEWGGGLRRIDRRTGSVSTIESGESGEICGGLLDADCDPINGIVTEPWNSRCIAAAVGLVHMIAHGRIVEVCGTNVRRLYSRPMEGPKTEAGEPWSTVAFFGLSAQGDALWAAGIDGLYEISADGTAKSHPMSDFKEIGGVYVNFDSPDMILVLTQINRRRSVSGAVPLLVSRH